MTFHTGQQASKQMQCKPRGTPSRELQKRSPLSRNVGRPLTSIVLTLTLPKLHLATFKGANIYVDTIFQVQVCN